MEKIKRRYSKHWKDVGRETYFRFKHNGQGIQISFCDHAVMITHVVKSEELLSKLTRSNLCEWRNALLKVLFILGKIPDADRRPDKKILQRDFHSKYLGRKMS